PAGRQNPGAAADVQGVAVKPGATTPPRANDGNTATPATAPDLVLPPPSQLPRATDALQLSDLAADERKTLPPLKLSMHLWNDDPARRFVILDGYRLGEGDRIGGLVVTAILRDGVLLDWNGRALKVPLR
ncbi:MAG TPA: general secretion pathway protein GspB, partial [Xanthomonadaceae bacterium]|nr:general secretion pathway protein GspB [Xanthomonadaceae bacterium]